MMNSQYRLEAYLDEVFPNTGYFLEIGCWDGEHISQSYHLEQRGWQGLCVDPFPKNFHNRTTPVAQVAISADGLPREFIKVSKDRRHGGDVSYFSGFRDRLDHYWGLIWEYCDFESMWIPTVTMNTLYEQYGLPSYIDFLSVDTEGAEEEILLSIDHFKYQYGMIMFEHNGEDSVRNRIGAHLRHRGYTFFHQTEIDDIYIRKGLLQ